VADRARLDDEAVEQRLARLDELLERIGAAPGRTGDTALAAIRLLTQLYGEALARALDLSGPAGAAAFAEDELLGHLLVLHDLHPEPPEVRAARALDTLRPALRARGGDARLSAVADGAAEVRLTAPTGCGGAATAAEAEEAVRAAVTGLAPELGDVRYVQERPARPPAFVPLASVTRATPPATGAATGAGARPGDVP
jgi:Fe-S cluster biogenesis protein NfuA